MATQKKTVANVVPNPLTMSSIDINREYDAKNTLVVKESQIITRANEESTIKVVVVGKPKKNNCLRDVYPELVRTWHPKKNEKTTKEVSASSSLVYWWKCPKGPDHEVFCSTCFEKSFNFLIF
jgi:hypothetical protein